MSMALVVALGLVQLALTEKKTVRYEDFSLRAYYAAEAGIEDAIPRLDQLSNLAGAEVDEHMANPAFGLTVLTPTILAGDSNYTYTRSVGREDVWELERSIEENTTSQFDISDSGEVSLENSELEVKWEDLGGTCDENGNCENAVEAMLVWEIPATQNLMPNPSFEIDSNADGVVDISSSGTKSWNKINGFGQIGMDTTYSKYGTTSQKIVDNTNLWPVGITLSQTSGNLIPVLPDTTYTLSVYVYIASLGGGYVRLGADVWDAGQTAIGNSVFVKERQLNQTTGIYWERLYLTFTTTTNAAFLQPFLYMTDSAVGEIYADGMQLEVQAMATAYCDGTPGLGFWDGPGAPPFSSSSRTGSFDMDRYLFDARTPPICDPCTMLSGCYNSYGRSCGNWDPVDHQVNVSIPVDQASSNRALRIKSMLSPIQVTIRARSATWPTVTYKLVGQEIVINSTGYFSNTRKTLQVQHGLPSLMPQFDYVLYNYGCVDATCIPRDLIK